MQFLKSLFCIKGYDNKFRFFTICCASYIVFIIFSSTVASNIFLTFLFIAVLFIVLSATSIRRLHDAKLNKNWLFAHSLTFLIVSIIIFLHQENVSYLLLFLPLIFTILLMRFSSKRKLKYILGYYGPINLEEYKLENNLRSTKHSRIEPTLVCSNVNNLNVPPDFGNKTLETNSYNEQKHPFSLHTNLTENIPFSTIIKKIKSPLMIVAIIGLIFIATITSWLLSYLDNDDETLSINQNKANIIATKFPKRSNPLPMPDNYSLYLSEHRGVSINWQADETNQSVFWSQLTAKGDESCKEISFNKGEAIRTLSVQIENLAGVNNNYFANFSPLDSQKLIQALAFRGSFSLCGYKFSLKGSQAALATNKEYANWVNY